MRFLLCSIWDRGQHNRCVTARTLRGVTPCAVACILIAACDVAVVTTTYGRTVAIDADSGRILWTFTPPGYGRVAGSSQITTTSPLVDPSRAFVYAASPDGLVHKLALASGTEAREGSWPVSVTRDASHEKLAAALNVVGGDLVAVT